MLLAISLSYMMWFGAPDAHGRDLQIKHYPHSKQFFEVRKTA